ncbi:adhesion G protein-coupled receptor B3-like [Apostichopus japonicus]|uniref:adhesion G protein-coupled receptor B3-like n=1 Tax=Stichopus japonicus TaxID=307972 RepID=UPI003AB7BDC0
MAVRGLNLRAFFYISFELVLFPSCVVLATTCNEEEVDNVVWPATQRGNVATLLCLSGIGNMTRTCLDSSVWDEEINSTACSSETIEALKDEWNEPNMTVSTEFTLALATSSASLNTSGELLQVVLLIQNVMRSGPLEGSHTYNQSIIVVQNILTVVSNTMQLQLETEWSNIHKFHRNDVFLMYIKTIQDFGSDVLSYLSTVSSPDMVTFSVPSIEARYEVKPKRDAVDFNISLGEDIAKIPISSYKKSDVNKNIGVAVLLFDETVQHLLPSSAVLPSISHIPYDITSALLCITQFPIQSPLLATDGNADRIQLILRTSMSNLTTCGLMNFSSSDRLWVNTDCAVVEVKDGNVHCNCTAISLYAVFNKVPRSLPPVVLAVLILTELFLWATILMLLYANRKMESDLASVVKLFLLTMSATHITLMAGLYSVHNENACTAVALLLHFFELSEAFWLLGMVVQLVLKVTYRTTESGSVSQYMALGWITPLFVVASTAGLKISQYGTEYYCFLNIENDIFYAFAVPAVLIVATAFICLIYIAYAYLVLRKKNRKAHRRLVVILPNIRASMVACVTLVLDWIATTLSLTFFSPLTMCFFALLKLTEAICIFLLFGIFSSEVRHEYEKRYGRCWPNRRKKFNPQRPGTNDELSQIRDSSVVHDLDSTISSTGPLAAFNRAPSSNSNGGYNFSNSTTSLRKTDFNSNTNGSNPFITRGLESNGSRPVVHTVSMNANECSSAGTSGLKEEPHRKEVKPSEPTPPSLSTFKGLSLKHKLKVFPLLKHEEEQEPTSIT